MVRLIMCKALLYSLCILTVWVSVSSAQSALPEEVEVQINAYMADYTPIPMPSPYSSLIEHVQIGCDASGKPMIGIAARTIESFKPITGLVVVERTDEGFLLIQATFPDIARIKNGKNRRKVQALTQSLHQIPFQLTDETPPIDGMSSATRYSAKALHYFNYMARTLARELDARATTETPKIP